MYTYILKDSKLGIYKIGKTKYPLARFKSLCVRGVITPIALVNRDVEKKLHAEYKENRVNHPDFDHNGGTEWFKKGGKFDAFIAKVDTGTSLPYITLHEMVTILLESGCIHVPDSSTQWEVDGHDFSRYKIGLELLHMLKFIERSGNSLTNKDKKNVLLMGKKISVSEKLIEFIEKRFKVYLGIHRDSGVIKEMADKERYGSRLRRIVLDKKEMLSEVFLLLNRVVLKKE